MGGVGDFGSGETSRVFPLLSNRSGTITKLVQISLSDPDPDKNLGSGRANRRKLHIFELES